MDYFNRKYIEVAYRAHDLQHLLRWLSDQHLKNALSKNLIMNFPVLLDDMRHSHDIYGPATDILKEVMVRKNPKTYSIQTTHSSTRISYEAPSRTTIPYEFFLHKRKSICHHDHWQGELQDNQAMPRSR